MADLPPPPPPTSTTTSHVPTTLTDSSMERAMIFGKMYHNIFKQLFEQFMSMIVSSTGLTVDVIRGLNKESAAALPTVTKNALALFVESNTSHVMNIGHPDFEPVTPKTADLSSICNFIGYICGVSYVFELQHRKKAVAKPKVVMNSVDDHLTAEQRIDSFGSRPGPPDPKTGIPSILPLTFTDALLAAQDTGGFLLILFKKYPWICGRIMMLLNAETFARIIIKVLRDFIYAIDFFVGFYETPMTTQLYNKKIVQCVMEGINGEWPGPTVTINGGHNVLIVQQLLFVPFRLLTQFIGIQELLSLMPGNEHYALAIWPSQENVDVSTAAMARDFLSFIARNGGTIVEQIKSVTGVLTGAPASDAGASSSPHV